MVRLWGIHSQTTLPRYVISIPVWYDYEDNNYYFIGDGNTFQFQYGTIMSGRVRSVGKNLFEFQFQYGTIMSTPNSKTRSALRDFNSSMVRLWAFLFSHFPVIFVHFNSSMVRLWDTTLLGSFTTNLFQFQYGTIMRLGGSIAGSGQIGFQFQYGTIMSYLSPQRLWL